jgi:hypothetical protein
MYVEAVKEVRALKNSKRERFNSRQAAGRWQPGSQGDGMRQPYNNVCDWRFACLLPQLGCNVTKIPAIKIDNRRSLHFCVVFSFFLLLIKDFFTFF